MANFVAIAFVDDWFDLAASLRTRMGLFKPESDGILTVWVRTTRPSDPDSFGYTKGAGVASGKWPELKIVLDRLKSMAEQQGGAELGRVWLGMLPPGAGTPWTSAWREGCEHVRLLLRGNPGLVFYGGAETWMPTIGVLTLVNRRAPNSAVNMGESPAIWLAVDFRRVAPPTTGEG